MRSDGPYRPSVATLVAAIVAPSAVTPRASVAGRDSPSQCGMACPSADRGLRLGRASTLLVLLDGLRRLARVSVGQNRGREVLPAPRPSYPQSATSKSGPACVIRDSRTNSFDRRMLTGEPV